MTLRSGGYGHSCFRRGRFTWYRHPFIILLISLSFGGDSFLRISIGTRAGALVGCYEARGAGSDHGRDCACVKFGLLKERKRRSIK
jgi:hypothetical protein